MTEFSEIWHEIDQPTPHLGRPSRSDVIAFASRVKIFSVVKILVVVTSSEQSFILLQNNKKPKKNSSERLQFMRRFIIIPLHITTCTGSKHPVVGYNE